MEKKKIIHRLKIDVKKNCSAKYEEAITFNIKQVFKTTFQHYIDDIDPMFGHNWGSDLDETPNQLMNHDMFSSSIDFDNLNYKLQHNEDLTLVQNIQFENEYKLNNGVKYGEAKKPYVEYDICLVYSND